MKEYDSILKEKIKYEDPEPIIKHNKYTKYLILDVLAIIFIIIISYIVYYHSILSPNQILIHDFNALKEQCQNIFMPLDLNPSLSNYATEGTIQVDELVYNYGLVRDKNQLKLELTTQEKKLAYYKNDTNQYIKLTDFRDFTYLILNNSSSSNIMENIKKHFNKVVTQDKYIKKFYLQNKKPIVEINLVLESNDIKNLLGTSLQNEDWEFILTLKNHAITDDLLDVKLVLNNKTKNTRQVFSFSGNTLTYTNNDGKVTKYILQENGEDFTLKIMKDDILYSVFSGTKKESSYHYSYQIIDQVYNLSLVVSHNQNMTTYDFASHIETNHQTIEKKASVTKLLLEDGLLEEDISNATSYSQLMEDEKKNYQQALDHILSPLREFIQEYQSSVD